MDPSLWIGSITSLFTSFVSYRISKEQARQQALPVPAAAPEVAQGEQIYALIQQSAKLQPAAQGLLQAFEASPSHYLLSGLEQLLRERLDDPDFRAELLKLVPQQPAADVQVNFGSDNQFHGSNVAVGNKGSVVQGATSITGGTVNGPVTGVNTGSITWNGKPTE